MTAPATRRLVVADVETSGLRPEDVVTEIAWRDADTGEHGLFVPAHDVDWVLAHGQPEALDMTGYRDRIAHARQDDGTELARLTAALERQSLAGACPTFDATRLAPLVGGDVWHHRIVDVEAYAAGALRIDPRELPKLSEVCRRLGVPLVGHHTAMGDVDATVSCFIALQHHQHANDEHLVERAAAWLHNWPGATRPWREVDPTQRQRLMAMARGVLALADGTVLTFPGDPG